MYAWGRSRLIVALTVAVTACQSGTPPPADARSGFTVDVDGFSFMNFGGDSPTARLTPELVARLYGSETVCASTTLGQCRLTPLANTWMQKVNASMRGGRCEGFAVLSGLFYQGVLSPADFGADDAFDLPVSNPQVSREIAYWFSTQFLRDVVKDSTRALDARAAVDFLAQAYRTAPPDELFRVGMVKVSGSGKVTGGHAMIATAVLVDEPGRRMRIEVYDNNHPGQPRFIEVDWARNTWAYQASRNPDEAASLYQGSPENRNPLYFAPLKNRTGVQRCSFCSGSDEGADALNQIFSFGSVEVAAVDGSGNATGVVDGAFVNTLPGASMAPNFSTEPWQDPMPPILFVPATATKAGQSLTFRVMGTGGDEPMHMTMFSAGRSVGLSGAPPAQGTSDRVTVSNGGASVSVTRESDAGASDFTVTAISETADGGQVEVSVTVPADGGAVSGASLDLDPSTGNATVGAQGPSDVAIEVAIVQSTADDEVLIEGSMTAPAGGSLQLNIAGYQRDAGVLEVAVDQDGDGVAELTTPVTNHGPTSPPAAPASLTAMAVAHDRVQLTWRDSSRYETGFVIERATGAGGFARLVELPAQREAFRDETVIALDTYRYRVRATNAFGGSEWSNEVTVSSPDCPPGLQDLDRNGSCLPRCEATTCGANAQCADTSGVAVCSCRPGFMGDGTTCVDVDECLTDNGGCGDAARWTCTNNQGAAPTCADVDECLTNNGGCGDAARWTCTNNVGAAPTCADVDECVTNNGGCGDSSRWTCTNNQGAAPTCADVNECLTNNGGCGDSSRWTCTNNVGAAPTCADLDECLTNNGGCGDAARWTCTNNVGAAPTCADLNECLTNNGGCGDSSRWTCTNNVGTAPTCADLDECLTNNGGCGDATRWTCTNNAGAAPTCADLNECLTNNGGCGDAARWTCTNNVGAAPTCADLNECLTNNGGCGDATRWTCTNNAGAAPTCADLDECLTNNGGCGDAARWTCTNNVGAAPTCADLDECLTNNGGCGDAARWTCTNNVGSAPTCADLDECLTNNGGCGASTAAVCTNRVGLAPRCACRPGYGGALCGTRREFVTSHVDPASDDSVLDLVRDGAGNLFLAVQYSAATTWGSVALAARGGTDVAIVSYTSSGDVRWAWSMGGPGNDRVTRLGIDSAGNLFVIGTVAALPVQLDASTALSSVGGFLVSLSSTGTFRWSRPLPSDPRALAVDATGNVAVGGLARVPFDYGLGVQQARGNGDAFLASYSNDGLTPRWVNVFGTDAPAGPPDNSFNDLAFDSSGVLYAAGHLGGPNGHLGGAVLPYAGQQTAALASYAANGAHRWSRSFVASGVSFVDSAATALSVDAAGRVAASFRFRDTIDFGGGPLTTPNPGAVGVGGTQASALVLFDVNTGGFVSQRAFLSGLPVVVNDVAFDATGELLLAGNAGSAGADFGGGPSPSGAFVAGYSNSLSWRFSKLASGGSGPSAQAVVAGDDGAVFVTGRFDNATLSFGTGSVSEGGAGADVWLARLQPRSSITAGLIARYDARDHASLALSAGAVSGWNDLSGQGHRLTTGSGTPTWLASGLNGRPALDFATDRGLVSQPFLVPTQVTVFLVAAWGSAPDTWGNLVHHGNRDDDWSLERAGSLVDTVQFQSVNDNTTTQLTCSVGAPTLFIGTISGTTRTLRLIDATGDRSTSGSGVSINSIDRILWVGRSDVGESSNAVIGELVYFNRALSPAETDQLAAELVTTWGIPR